MEGLPQGIEDIGVLGAFLLGMFLLMRQLLLGYQAGEDEKWKWVQERMDQKDQQLTVQHEKVLIISGKVIELSDKMVVATEAATRAAENTAATMATMGEGIKTGLTEVCMRLEKVENKLVP